MNESERTPTSKGGLTNRTNRLREKNTSESPQSKTDGLIDWNSLPNSKVTLIDWSGKYDPMALRRLPSLLKEVPQGPMHRLGLDLVIVVSREAPLADPG
jgi:hypothetical protein